MIGALALDGVDYALADGAARRSLLANCSLRFDPGRFTCLTGPSGCGKTTILSLLAGVCLPDRGRIMDGEQDIAALDEAARRAWRAARVGLVFQTCRLIDVLTVAEHMALVARLRGRPEAASEGIRRAMALGLGDRLNQLPGQLSGGEKQRVALAQALAHRPPIVLADEPTAALDRANAHVVADALKRYARESDAVVVSVSHDQAMIETADSVITLAPK